MEYNMKKNIKSIINEYIDEEISKVSNFNDGISFFNGLFKLCDDNRISLDPDFILWLLNNDNILNIIESIFNQFKSQIIAGEAEKIFGLSDFIMIIEMYCMIKDIQIKEPTEEKHKEDTFYYDSYYAYSNDIRKIPLLTADEEKELFIKYQNGDQQAREKLISSNLRLVVKIAKAYDANYSLPDLVQEGNIGLMKAIDKFNPALGYKLSTYATWWIKQSIIRAIDNYSRTIRIPAYIGHQIYKFEKTFTELENILGRKPTNKEMSEKMDVSEEMIVEYAKISYLNNIKSLNEIIMTNQEYTSEIIDFIPSDEETVEDQAIKSVGYDEFMKIIENINLTSREKTVLFKRFGISDDAMTFREIGEELNVSHQRVQQNVKRAIEKIRKYSKIKSFYIYMDYPEKALRIIPENKINYGHVMIADVPARIFKTMYELLSEYSKEEIDLAISELSDEEKNLLIYRHGPNFDIPCANTLTQNELIKYCSIKQKIRKKIDKQKGRYKYSSYQKS